MGAGHASCSLFRRDAGYFRGLGVPAVYQAHDTYVDRAGRNVGRILTGKMEGCAHFTSARSDQRLLPLKGEIPRISFAVQESAVGPKRRFAVRSDMSEVGGEADMPRQPNRRD
jgi:hypothetical protein